MKRRGRPPGSRNKVSRARVAQLCDRELDDLLRLTHELGRLEAQRDALVRELERVLALTEDEYLAEEVLAAFVAARQAAAHRNPGCGCCG